MLTIWITPLIFWQSNKLLHILLKEEHRTTYPFMTILTTLRLIHI